MFKRFLFAVFLLCSILAGIGFLYFLLVDLPAVMASRTESSLVLMPVFALVVVLLIIVAIDLMTTSNTLALDCADETSFQGPWKLRQSGAIQSMGSFSPSMSKGLLSVGFSSEGLHLRGLGEYPPLCVSWDAMTHCQLKPYPFLFKSVWLEVKASNAILMFPPNALEGAEMYLPQLRQHLKTQ